VQADTLIGDQVVPGDAALDAEVSGVLAGVDGAQRDDKAEAVG
jgi:inorganic pyrophosphatase